MPISSKKPCAHPSCPNLISRTERYCDAHKHYEEQHKASYHKHYDDTRPSPSKRGYGRRWQKIRLQHLRKEPLCRMCQARGKVTAAQHVDHIIPLKAGGTHDVENLQSLCQACHNAKTARESMKTD